MVPFHALFILNTYCFAQHSIIAQPGGGLTTQIHTRISFLSLMVRELRLFKMWQFTVGLGFNFTFISFWYQGNADWPLI